MNYKKDAKKRRFFLQASTIAAATSNQWLKPTVNSIITPAHAQTSNLPLCQDGTTQWLMSDYTENNVAFNQGSPQSQVQIVISGTSINLTTDWFIVNSNTNTPSRGRVTDQGTINLTSGTAITNPTGSPISSPTHGGVINLANNLTQSFTLDCSNSGDFMITDNSGIYSFRLSRIS